MKAGVKAFTVHFGLAAAITIRAAVAASTIVPFPGSRSAPDPSGRFEVVWREATSRLPHQLLLKTLSTGEMVPLLTFNRHVTVLWAPDGNALAITDWVGSDSSELWVVRPDRLQDRVDIAKRLERAFGKLPQIAANHHVYFEAVAWRSANVLRFKVRGYGDHDPHGFEQLFDWEVGGRVQRVQ